MALQVILSAALPDPTDIEDTDEDTDNDDRSDPLPIPTHRASRRNP